VELANEAGDWYVMGLFEPGEWIYVMKVSLRPASCARRSQKECRPFGAQRVYPSQWSKGPNARSFSVLPKFVSPTLALLRSGSAEVGLRRGRHGLGRLLKVGFGFRLRFGLR